MGQLPRRGPVLVLPADFLALQGDGVPAPRAPATTRSRPRREWVSRVRHVPARTALDPQRRGLLPAAHRSQALVRECLVCRDQIRR
jgi:hypothetical protein